MRILGYLSMSFVLVLVVLWVGLRTYDYRQGCAFEHWVTGPGPVSLTPPEWTPMAIHCYDATMKATPTSWHGSPSNMSKFEVRTNTVCSWIFHTDLSTCP